MNNKFSISRLPRIEFGSGTFDLILNEVRQHGNSVLLVTGAISFFKTPQWQQLHQEFKTHKIIYETVNINGEPSPDVIDDVVATYRKHNFSVVLGIGGGSALDAAKAIAGLLCVEDSVMDYLEGVGPEKKYTGPALPFIAVPTTAGTGSEATKNAVLSRQGKNGFKKSFRDEKLVADVAIVDPDLLATCPREVIAANGMDALTQLIESYVSIKANRFIDSLVIEALACARDGLLTLFQSGGSDATARENMAYASLVSGISLAQNGLGSVHGLASPLGAFYPIPHGLVCGTLVAAATEINIHAMLSREPDNPALERYAQIADILVNNRHDNLEGAWHTLIKLLHQWTEALDLKKLSHFGLASTDLDHVVAHSRGSSMKTNPIVLTDEEIRAVMVERL